MTNRAGNVGGLRTAVLLVGIFLPTLTLIPFGSIWLWQHGLLLYWALCAMISVAVATYVQRRLFGVAVTGAKAAEPLEPLQDGDPNWTAAEFKAWSAVLEIVRRTDAGSLSSRDAVLDLGAQTIRAVAHLLHPEVKEPLWQFTVPEAFALLERVSGRLGGYAMENVPLGDRFTVAQMLAVYRWRGALDVAERVYDVWRLMRMANPLTAVTHELRERLSKQMLDWGRAHVTDRLMEAYVKEVGRAAIDLYGGRMHVSARAAKTASIAASNEGFDTALEHMGEPLRLLIAGQATAGKSYILTALKAETVASLNGTRAGLVGSVLVEALALSASAKAIKKLVEQASGCDLLLLVMPADRTDVEAEREVLKAFRMKFQSLPRRNQPPIIAAVTYMRAVPPIEGRRGADDGSSLDEPYTRLISDRIGSVAVALGLDDSEVVAVGIDGATSCDIHELNAAIAAHLRDAQRAKVSRLSTDIRQQWRWRKIWSQAVGAGRVIGGAFRS